VIIAHSFLVIPEYPYTLVGQDLLHKLQATISFQEEGTYLDTQGQPPIKLLFTCPLSEEYLLYMTEQNPPETRYMSELRKMIPHVWAKSNPLGLAHHHAPIVVQLISQAMPIQVKQNLINMESKLGIAIHIKRQKKAGIWVPCHSPWNTPLLPV
jgi:hypothetical protein